MTINQLENEIIKLQIDVERITVLGNDVAEFLDLDADSPEESWKVCGHYRNAASVKSNMILELISDIEKGLTVLLTELVEKNDNGAA